MAAVCLATFFPGTPTLLAQPALLGQADRIEASADLSASVQLSGHRPAWAVPANDVGEADPSRQLDHVVLMLRRAPAAEQAFQQLLLDQQNPTSPRYHQWLTAAQSGTLYGPTANDRNAIAAWLVAQGLRCETVSPTGMFLSFSGSVGTVARALGTSFHTFAGNGGRRISITSEPSIPAAFAPVIDSFVGLSEESFVSDAHAALAPMPGTSATTAELRPEYTSGTSHFLSPKDFATIYDLNSAYNAGINGATVHVAVIGGSRVSSSDISLYETYTGLSQYQPNVVVLPGAVDPGYTADSAQGEATLDVDRVTGTAPGAAIDLLVATNALAYSNTILLLGYEISTLNDPIVSMSFGACEAYVGSNTKAFDTIFAQGAAQGITFLASSGDSSAAGCDAAFVAAPAVQVLNASFLCASSYVTCVGGTEFADTASPATYWSATNGTFLSSALSYIPEGAWNEPQGTSGYVVAGSGGGVSTVIAKPVWQMGVGVPADGFRDTPDVAFSSSSHNGYFGCAAYAGADCIHYITVFSGTSAAAPSMAGIMALVNQKLGTRQGNYNPKLYGLAASPGNGVFHDATIASSGVGSCSATMPSMCNNSTPSATALVGGLAGYMLATGYDQATGWGSIDVGNLLTALAPQVSTTLALTANPTAITTAQTAVFTASLTPSRTTGLAAPTGTVQFYANGAALGAAVALVSSAAATPSLMFPIAGSYAITATYSGDTTYIGSAAPALTLNVTTPGPPGFSIVPAQSSIVLSSGASGSSLLTYASAFGFSGTVAQSCAVTFNGAGSATNLPTCSFTSPTVMLAAGGTATGTITIASTAPHANVAAAVNDSGGMRAGVALGCLLMLLLPVSTRRLPRLRTWNASAMLLALALVLGATSGCGGAVSVAANTQTIVAGTTTGAYTVSLTSFSGSTVATPAASIALTIQ